MMKLEIQGATLELVQGDITRQQVDAIVNAANSRRHGVSPYSCARGCGITVSIAHTSGFANARLLIAGYPAAERTFAG